MTQGATIRFGHCTIVALLCAGFGTSTLAQEATARDAPQDHAVSRQPILLNPSVTFIASVQSPNQLRHIAPDSATAAPTRSATTDRKSPHAFARDDALASAQCGLDLENQHIASMSVRSAMRPCAAHVELRRPFGQTP